MVYKYTLTEQYKCDKIKLPEGESYGLKLPNNKLCTLSSAGIVIQEGFAYDGCTPKFKLGKRIVGVWDGFYIQHEDEGEIYQACKYASLVHDFLYQIKQANVDCSLTYSEIDNLFYQMLVEEDFGFAGLYFLAVRCYSSIFLEEI